MKITVKLILLCLALVISSAVILIFFTQRKFAESLSNESIQRYSSQNTTLVNFLEADLQKKIAILKATLGNVNSLSEEELESMNTSGFSTFGIYDITGQLLFSSTNWSFPVHFSASESSQLLYADGALWFAIVGENGSKIYATSKAESFIDNALLAFGDTPFEYAISLNEDAVYRTSNWRKDIPPVSNESGYRNILDGILFSQIRMLFPGYTIKLSIFLPSQVINAPLIEFRGSIILIITLVLIGATIVSIVVARISVKPIIELSRAAGEIGKGKLNTPIKIESKDEIGQLAKEFSNTARVLATRIGQQKQMNEKLQRQRNEVIRQKEKAEESAKQIRESISYARRIQRYLLPDLSGAGKLISGAQVFYQPKDLVSGDFFWFERVRKGRNDFLVAAVADCTGHGVPGAIMSIMGSNQLTNIVYYQNYLDPQKIVARLDRNIKLELYRDEEDSGEIAKDGMEIGVVVINLDDYSMEFSGAGIPLYHYRDGELHQFKSVKEMAGGFPGEEREVEASIIKETFTLKKGDRLFLSSDGFQDQFGGPDDKRYMAKNFRQLIQDSSRHSLENQYKQIAETFRTWKGNNPQTDDVVVMCLEF